MKVESMIAILIIDMQKCFLQPLKSTREFEGACEHINYVADILRSNDQVVVHVQDVEQAAERSKEELSIVDEIDVKDKDLKMTKTASNSFWKTDLEKNLTDLGVDLLIISGFAAEYCVLFTYNGAYERGFNAVMLQNGILSFDKSNVESTYQSRHVISFPVLEAIFGKK